MTQETLNKQRYVVRAMRRAPKERFTDDHNHWERSTAERIGGVQARRMIVKHAVPAMALFALSAVPAVAATATPADRAFVAKVSQGGMFEVAAGKLAETKGSTQDIRDFGSTEVHDHMLVGNKLKAISAGAGIPVAASLNAEFAGKLTRLKGLAGTAFDRAYLNEMATLHDGDGAAFAKEASDGGSSAFRAFGTESHRIVQRHIGAIHGAPLPSGS